MKSLKSLDKEAFINSCKVLVQKSKISNTFYQIIVTTREDIPIGSVILTLNPEYMKRDDNKRAISLAHAAWLSHLFINLEFRGKGVASLLINKCIELAKEKSAQGIGLVVNPSNLHAIKVYHKKDFFVIGVQPNGYYLMAKKLEYNE